jgi:hypothetical protein
MDFRGLGPLITTPRTIIRTEVKVLHSTLLPKARHRNRLLETFHIARLPARRPELSLF